MTILWTSVDNNHPKAPPDFAWGAKDKHFRDVLRTKCCKIVLLNIDKVKSSQNRNCLLSFSLNYYKENASIVIYFLSFYCFSVSLWRVLRCVCVSAHVWMCLFVCVCVCACLCVECFPGQRYTRSCLCMCGVFSCRTLCTLFCTEWYALNGRMPPFLE